MKALGPSLPRRGFQSPALMGGDGEFGRWEVGLAVPPPPQVSHRLGWTRCDHAAGQSRQHRAVEAMLP